MFRDLKAIEIAEGALLADIAVIFQLLVIYMPVGGDFFRLLIFGVFTILVLRRGLYVGIMGMAVAMFIIMVVTGFHGMSFMLLEGTGGLFLGVTMKLRVRHIPLILLGTTCGALALWCLSFALTYLVGGSWEPFIRSLHTLYKALIAFANGVAPHLGLAVLWQQHLYPFVDGVASLAFTYWWATLYVGMWIILCPFVSFQYAITNLLVRLLGYDVRPFPGGRLGRWLQWMRRRLLRFALKRGLLKKIGVRA